VLDDCVGVYGRFYFDRGIAAFGRAVHARLDEVSQSENATIARAQRIREWERIMGGDNIAAAFADPSADGGITSHGRAVGREDAGDDDITLGDGEFY
jgi:hypothetical protein